MKATQITLEKTTYLSTMQDAKSHYKVLMRKGVGFPTTQAQATYFITAGCCLEMLNYSDLIKLESFLNKHGLEGDYIYTKSQSYVRLTNSMDLYLAIKKEFINK